MAKEKKPTTSPAGITEAPMMPKPSVRMDVSPSMDMPKVGQSVRVAFSGKVISTESRKDRYGDGKQKATVEVEHDMDSLRMSAMSGHAKIDKMSEEQKRKMKQEHPDTWRQYLGGPK